MPVIDDSKETTLMPREGSAMTPAQRMTQLTKRHERVLRFIQQYVLYPYRLERAYSLERKIAQAIRETRTRLFN
jgi:hypothetical protein